MSRSVLLLIVSSLTSLLLVAAGCGGGSEGDDPVFPGNIVPLTATVNGQAASGNMTLILAQSTPVSNVIAYQVNSFTLLNEQLRVTGTGFLSSDIADRRVMMTIDVGVAPVPDMHRLVGEGPADSIVPLRFTDLVLQADDFEIVLSTD